MRRSAGKPIDMYEEFIGYAQIGVNVRSTCDVDQHCVTEIKVMNSGGDTMIDVEAEDQRGGRFSIEQIESLTIILRGEDETNQFFTAMNHARELLIEQGVTCDYDTELSSLNVSAAGEPK